MIVLNKITWSLLVSLFGMHTWHMGVQVIDNNKATQTNH